METPIDGYDLVLSVTTSQLITLINQSDRLGEWRAYREPMTGCIYFSRPEGAFTVWASPDWEANEIIAWQIDSAIDGETLEADSFDWPSDERTVASYLALVLPLLASVDLQSALAGAACWTVPWHARQARYFPVGARVVTISPIDRFPSFMVGTARLGTVTVSDERTLAVKMDDPIDGAAEWGNEIVWSDDDLQYLADDLALAIPYAIAEGSS